MENIVEKLAKLTAEVRAHEIVLARLEAASLCEAQTEYAKGSGNNIDRPEDEIPGKD